MTAIAAVLALSSTPLAAQEATSTDVPMVTIPAPESVAPVADPLAPTPEASAPAETPAAAETVAAEPAEATPAAKPVARKAAAKVERTPARAATKASMPAAAPTPATAAVVPAPTPVAEAAPAPAPEPAPVEQAKGPKIDEAIPLAGGAGAVILALAGAGMAMRRRKRHDEEGGEYQDEMLLTDETSAEPEPVWNPPVIQPRAVPMAATRTDVAEGFDTSQFGRHVQAAYAGPTPENPSLSLRKRLKLAGELDRRERAHGTAPKVDTPVSAKPAQPTGFMLSGTATQARTPEYQF